jgi:hypothetical protein
MRVKPYFELTPLSLSLCLQATGNLGVPVVRALTSSGFQVSILTRAADKKLANTRAIVTDYSKASLLEAFQGQDAVVSTLGGAGVLHQREMIDAAVTAGIKRFIPADFAPYTPDLGDMADVVPPIYARLQPKQALQRYLEDQTTAHPGFSWSAVGSGALFEWVSGAEPDLIRGVNSACSLSSPPLQCLKTGAQGMSLANRSAVVVDSGDEPYLSTTAAQIGRAVAYILAHPQDTANRYMLVSSFITTQNQLLGHLEKATQAKWRVDHVPSEQREKEGMQLLAQGNFAGLGHLWTVCLNSDGRGEAARLQKHIANDSLHLPVEDIDEVIKELLIGQ